MDEKESSSGSLHSKDLEAGEEREDERYLREAEKVRVIVDSLCVSLYHYVCAI